jgi:redox-sensing transcriptional repressor
MVGVGNLGSALLRYSGFRKEGFEVIAAFDADPAHVKATTEQMGVPVYHVRDLGKYVSEHGVRMAIIAVPESAGQEVADILVEAGVQAILNFSPAVLNLPDEVVVNQVDLAAELRSLSFFAN